jgi:hypothetical protein
VGPYLHPVELVVRGDYLNVLAYLKELEAENWGFQWRRFELSLERRGRRVPHSVHDAFDGIELVGRMKAARCLLYGQRAFGAALIGAPTHAADLKDPTRPPEVIAPAKHQEAARRAARRERDFHFGLAPRRRVQRPTGTRRRQRRRVPHRDDHGNRRALPLGRSTRVCSACYGERLKHGLYKEPTPMKRLRFPLLSLLLLAAPLAAPAADEEPRFNITVVNTPAKSFFLGLVHDTPYNMVVSADVSGSISLDLKQVTVPEVLQMTRELYGYDFEKLPAGFLVLPATIQSRMFYVNYVDLERSGTSRTRVSSGQLTQSGQTECEQRRGRTLCQPGGQAGMNGQNTARAAAAARA